MTRKKEIHFQDVLLHTFSEALFLWEPTFKKDLYLAALKIYILK